MDAQYAMMPEIQARRLLGADCNRVRLVSPVGGWIGVGRLRVLGIRVGEAGVELLAGYERYESIEAR